MKTKKLSAILGSLFVFCPLSSVLCLLTTGCGGGGGGTPIQPSPPEVNVWQKTYGGSDFEWAREIHQTSDGGYIVAGMTGSFGGGAWDFYIIKTDASGNTGPNPAKAKIKGISKIKENPFDRFFRDKMMR